jgi:hypothetical protein
MPFGSAAQHRYAGLAVSRAPRIHTSCDVAIQNRRHLGPACRWRGFAMALPCAHSLACVRDGAQDRTSLYAQSRRARLS